MENELTPPKKLRRKKPLGIATETPVVKKEVKAAPEPAVEKPKAVEPVVEAPAKKPWVKEVRPMPKIDPSAPQRGIRQRFR